MKARRFQRGFIMDPYTAFPLPGGNLRATINWTAPADEVVTSYEAWWQLATQDPLDGIWIQAATGISSGATSYQFTALPNQLVRLNIKIVTADGTAFFQPPYEVTPA
jgi:hypothetical protein